jgi:hypothetical protein
MLVVAPLFASSPAAADRETCARAYEVAQMRRQEAKLIEARRELVTCAQDSCPAVLRKDCVAWLSEVEAELPALSIRVQASDGCDRPDALVSVDGAEIPRAAEGRPVEVDPGSHTVRATLGKLSAEQVVVIAAGERRRLVTIPFGARGLTCHTADASAPRKVDAQTTAPPSGAESRKIPVPVYVLGGVGLLSMGLGAGFGLSAFSQKGTLDDCKGSCSQSDVDTMQRTFLIADVASIVALGSLAVAGLLYFTRP